MSFAYALLALNLLATRQVPPGTQLHIRLTTTVGSYASRAGDPVNAVLIAPVVAGGETILPAGSVISGRLKSVQRVGLGFIHELAALDLEFTGIAAPNGENVPLLARIQEVDNARERLTAEGSIRGTRPTSTLSYRFGGYIRTAIEWELHARLAIWAIKALLLQVPEPELYYPAGVEMTLALTEPVTALPSAGGIAAPRRLTPEEHSTMEAVLEELPTRTHAALSNRPSDLLNVMFIGTRDEVATAFEAAGWIQPKAATLRTNIHRIRAVADGRGDLTAPMSDLLVQDAKPEMLWQKSFNDVSKRHHIRIWKQSATWNGREVWVGAATHDVDFAYLRPGTAMTHKIAEDVDAERDKVANDLLFTACVDVADDMERLDVPMVTRNATGDPMRTDTRMSILELNECAAPQWTVAADTALPQHGSKMQRFARREILSFRSDVLRDNWYWRSYEGVRMMIGAYRQRGGRGEESKASTEARQSGNRASFVTDMFR
ncbi:MAG: LssY C-terminal domain-containing protein [Acidobacteriota bacterium]|nr:LssY C-terminal domain-containing protein [Acidobacteriota bacterium]